MTARRWHRLTAGLLLCGMWSVCAAGLLGKPEEDPDAPPWQEDELALPEFPKDADLIEFYVSAATTNRFFVDSRSLRVGKDGVVRYAIVVRTAGGATNISYEGIRCSEVEYRIYATGYADGTWHKARGGWRPIENKSMNRQHAALSRSLFCPEGFPIRTAAEGVDALKRGSHPDAK